MRSRGQPVYLLDLNHEGLEFLLATAAFNPEIPEAQSTNVQSTKQIKADTWTKGAILRKERNLASLRRLDTYRTLPRYTRAVVDLNRVLKTASLPFGAEASLANYTESGRSPLRREDLLSAASRFFDSPYFSLFTRRINEELERQPATIVGLSINYLSQALPAFAVLGWLAQAHPELSRIAGGGLISSWLSQGSLARDDSFGGLLHALVPGRAEDALSAWLGTAGLPEIRFPRQSLQVALNLASRTSAPAPASPPDFDDFSHLGYLSPVCIIPYAFSSGCPWQRCTFCPEKAEGARYVGLGVDTALAQLDQLASHHKPGLFHFTDNEISPLYLQRLAEKSPGIPWYGFARFSKVLLDPGFCRALAASGCRMLQLGLESADQKILDAMAKGTELGDIDRILENLAQAGIGTFLYVLFGTPAEDLSSARKTRDYLASRYALIDFLNIAIFNLPVASADAASLATRDFYHGTLSLYLEFEHPAGWDRSRVRGFITQELEAEPRIRDILMRTPPVFTSNHAAFFLE